jgi:D-tyrosyl-tRNA(Tyr) deacylase
MRSVVQRVTVASVLVEGQEIARIGTGLLALVGVGEGDDEGAAVTLADKIVDLRIFEDADGKMNQSVLDISGEVLLVSQFTLFGDARRGRRPSFTAAMEPVRAEALFQRVCDRVRERKIRVSTGKFRADMKVMLVNDGPVTLLLDTSKAF